MVIQELWDLTDASPISRQQLAGASRTWSSYSSTMARM
jgi:hypothetical protein